MRAQRFLAVSTLSLLLCAALALSQNIRAQSARANHHRIRIVRKGEPYPE
jgi:hypothetical protein